MLVLSLIKYSYEHLYLFVYPAAGCVSDRLQRACALVCREPRAPAAGRADLRPPRRPPYTLYFILYAVYNPVVHRPCCSPRLLLYTLYFAQPRSPSPLRQPPPSTLNFILCTPCVGAAAEPQRHLPTSRRRQVAAGGLDRTGTHIMLTQR